MGKTKFYISLSESEKDMLKQIIADQQADDATLVRAKILLLSDINNDVKLSLPKISQETGVSRQTIVKIKSIYAEQGLDIALHELKKKQYFETKRNDPILIEHIRSIASSRPPEGKSKWTLKTIADECIKLGYVDYISFKTVGNLINRYNISL